jgi:hypothetical protein
MTTDQRGRVRNAVGIKQRWAMILASLRCPASHTRAAATVSKLAMSLS